MLFKYSTADPSLSEFDSLPRLPIILRLGKKQISTVGLVDSGATVNVLPDGLGIRLGAIWDDSKATIRLAGNLGNFVAMPVVVTAEVESFSPVKLAFAWIKSDSTPLILGQMNFFLEFEVCFSRLRLEFEIKPNSP